MTFSTTGSKTELQAVNQILASVGQAPVTSIDTETITVNGNQVTVVTNPDVAIAYDTLQEVSREVQGEGWTFNKEFDYPFTPNNNNQILWPNNVLHMDLSDNPNYATSYREKDTVKREGKLYDRMNHTYTWTGTIYCDVLWFFEWTDLPSPIQDYITCRAAAIASSRLVGDATQYQILQQKEAYARAQALEYECNEGDYSMFGYPRQGTFYQSYQPYNALQRF